jgi:hypothetical protein
MVVIPVIPATPELGRAWFKVSCRLYVKKNQPNKKQTKCQKGGWCGSSDRDLSSKGEALSSNPKAAGGGVCSGRQSRAVTAWVEVTGDCPEEVAFETAEGHMGDYQQVLEPGRCSLLFRASHRTLCDLARWPPQPRELK